MTGRYEVVLVDLGGVVYVGDTPIAGSIDALVQLKDAGIAIRYITNTTRSTRASLIEKLGRIGLEVQPEELFTPAHAVLDYLRRNDLDPHFLVHPSLAPEFESYVGGSRPALVVGDAGDGFTYRALDEAFQILEAGAEFLALAKNRHFREADGKLHLDAGPFVVALEFAAQKKALLLGKPAADFFHSAVRGVGTETDKAIMIGDDVESDVAGAMHAGIQGILVRTGKYRSGDETKVSPSPSFVADDLPEAVDWLLRNRG